MKVLISRSGDIWDAEFVISGESEQEAAEKALEKLIRDDVKINKVKILEGQIQDCIKKGYYSDPIGEPEVELMIVDARKVIEL